MLKLLIVDDEVTIRRGLAGSINWEKYGVTIAGEARSGAAALEKALSLRPDIVISDIRMSNGDGLWFIRQMLEFLPQAKKIVLSGYSDKEYMMEAIKLDVNDYLLKPAGTEQILQAVLRQRDEILLERQRERQSTLMENIINENMDIIKAHFLRELLERGMPAHIIKQKVASCSARLQGPLYALFLAFPRPGRDWEMIQIISGRLEKYSPELVTLREGGVIAVMLNVEENLSGEEILSLVEETGSMEDPMFLPCYGGTSDLESMHGLYVSLSEMTARSLWFQEPYLAAQAHVRFGEIPEEDLLAFERGIVQCVQTGNFAAISRELDALLRLLEEVKPAYTVFQDIFLGIARSIQMFSDNIDIYAKLSDCFNRAYTPCDVKEAFLSTLNNDYSKYGYQIKKTLDFMMKNCAGDLSLTGTAAAMYISPGYLTRLLKSRTGRGFNEWLHIIRIDKAKELLEKTGLKFYEIAEQVGYSSYKIFSGHFGKTAGCSARAYREKVCAAKKTGAAGRNALPPDAPEKSRKSP
ncbi:MAG: response regulator [Treponema sp.]|jgi:YesN/AraC family two-component response regulator|nr:response regulator [Treponema sp.]